MNKLEHYLDTFDNKELSKDIFNLSNYFGYKNDDEYNHHLKFMLDNLYNIKLVESKRVRLNQKQFREELIKKFNGECLITGEDCSTELEACHIIPVAKDESYDIDNGLLLMSNLHKTFDKYLWSINPDTLIIETKTDKNIGTIKKYVGEKAKLTINPYLYSNLMHHYNEFKKID